MKSTNDIDLLLARHFCGESLTADQEACLSQWISQHEAEYAQMAALMAEDRGVARPVFDPVRAWRRIEPQLTMRSSSGRIRTLIACAASVVLWVGLAFWWNENRAPEPIYYANAGTENQTVQLPDSSSVVLYPASKIRYETYAKKHKRKLTLSGKAFFEVKRDEQCPFVVDARTVKVEVLGTSFLVDVADENDASVSVKSGVVQVAARGEQVVVTADEQVSITPKGVVKSTIRPQDDVFGERPAVLSFDDTPVTDVVRELERVFCVQIELGDKIAQNRITTQFKLGNLTDILVELSYLCDCKYDQVAENHYKLFYP